MRILKQSQKGFIPFQTSLEQLGKTGSGKYYLKTAKKHFHLLTENYSNYQASIGTDLYHYSQKLNLADTSTAVINIFKEEVKKLSFFNDAEIFVIGEKPKECVPANPACNQKVLNFIKNKSSNGIIDWIEDSKKMMILPFTAHISENQPSLNCLLIPVYHNKNFVGLLAAVTAFSFLSEDSVEYRSLKIILDITFLKLQYELLKNELLNNYSDLQALQSKMANDYKLAAIGEITPKAIEYIASSLQVISSCADIIESDYSNIDKKITQSLIDQVNEIKEVIERLTSFITSPDNVVKIQSCNINDVIKDFYKLIEHSLKAEAYECVLDLNENIPPILSNHNYLKQILINAFSLINPFNHNSGGILIQTRYSSGIILLKFSVTNNIDENINNEMGSKILKNLMVKHEGDFNYSSNSDSGTILTFSFPLKRKNRR